MIFAQLSNGDKFRFDVGQGPSGVHVKTDRRHYHRLGDPEPVDYETDSEAEVDIEPQDREGPAYVLGSLVRAYGVKKMLSATFAMFAGLGLTENDPEISRDLTSIALEIRNLRDRWPAEKE